MEVLLLSLDVEWIHRVIDGPQESVHNLLDEEVWLANDTAKGHHLKVIELHVCVFDVDFETEILVWLSVSLHHLQGIIVKELQKVLQLRSVNRVGFIDWKLLRAFQFLLYFTVNWIGSKNTKKVLEFNGFFWRGIFGNSLFFWTLCFTNTFERFFKKIWSWTLNQNRL